MKRKYKNPLVAFFKDFSYRVIRLKYFILVVFALLLQATAVAIYLFNSEDIIDFELFNASILFGATSGIIIILAIGILVLLRVDKTRDRNKIKLLLGFKRDYQKIKSKYIKEINRFTQAFDSENADIEVKVNYAIVLEDQYDTFLREFSSLKIPDFLTNAYDYESEHLKKEKQFYKKFSLLAGADELKDYSIESNLAHRNFIEELDKLEKSLKIVI